MNPSWNKCGINIKTIRRLLRKSLISNSAKVRRAALDLLCDYGLAVKGESGYKVTYTMGV